MPTRLNGIVHYHVDCGKSLAYIAESPADPCVDTSRRWPLALKTTWMTMQPDATIVVHTGWVNLWSPGGRTGPMTGGITCSTRSIDSPTRDRRGSETTLQNPQAIDHPPFRSGRSGSRGITPAVPQCSHPVGRRSRESIAADRGGAKSGQYQRKSSESQSIHDPANSADSETISIDATEEVGGDVIRSSSVHHADDASTELIASACPGNRTVGGTPTPRISNQAMSAGFAAATTGPIRPSPAAGSGPPNRAAAARVARSRLASDFAPRRRRRDRSTGRESNRHGRVDRDQSTARFGRRVQSSSRSSSSSSLR